MTAGTTPQSPAHAPIQPRRRRRWLRWTIIGVAGSAVLLSALVAAAIKLQPTPAPLTLPATASTPAGPLDGTYRAVAGSTAGFRIQQRIVGLTSDVVGRTKDVTGTVTIADGQATTARLRVGLLALTSGDAKPAPQFGISLDTQRYPDAAISLTQSVTLDPAFSSGTTVTANASGALTLHGIARPVTVAVSLRRDGTNIDVAGSFPVAFTDYSIARPKGYGAFGSLSDHGVAEFLLILQRP
ncbi:YceI family protein [Actinoplanes sp. KI2]|uniref:YceI family protein n=1 Tax=Actinoplanes sp. KI2 TaxID=2983315 RepID=UPI0021D608CD|nr:YceI family protein [Actinoplanes sp. KI2]MCU7725330.1 YceI family protein [Actinoplanes sp. KI2]